MLQSKDPGNGFCVDSLKLKKKNKKFHCWLFHSSNSGGRKPKFQNKEQRNPTVLGLRRGGGICRAAS